MNTYLKTIFEIAIQKIQSANIDYWVYGGVGYAAMFGSFYRTNSDIDLFVLENDFEKVRLILEDICKVNGWKIKEPISSSGHPIFPLVKQILKD